MENFLNLEIMFIRLAQFSLQWYNTHQCNAFESVEYFIFYTQNLQCRRNYNEFSRISIPSGGAGRKFQVLKKCLKTNILFYKFVRYD